MARWYENKIEYPPFLLNDKGVRSVWNQYQPNGSRRIFEKDGIYVLAINDFWLDHYFLFSGEDEARHYIRKSE
jgi:hypothetical protein